MDKETSAAKRNRKSDQQYGSYIDEVRSYLGKVTRGRSTREVDPGQEALGESAEMLRQTRRIDKANAYDKLMRSKDVNRR